MVTNNIRRLRLQLLIGGGLILGLLLLLTLLMQTTAVLAQPIESSDQPRVDLRRTITPTLSIRAFPATASIERVTGDNLVYLPLISRPSAPPLPPRREPRSSFNPRPRPAAPASPWMTSAACTWLTPIICRLPIIRRRCIYTARPARTAPTAAAGTAWRWPTT